MRRATTPPRSRTRPGASIMLAGICLVIGAACAESALGTAPSSEHATTTVAPTTDEQGSSSEATVADSVDTELTTMPESTDVATTAGTTADANTGASTDGDEFVPKKVAVVGDSLTVATRPLIANAIRSQGASVVRVDALEGRRMTGSSDGRSAGFDAVVDIIDSGFVPDLWVIELGTNDIGSEVEPESFRADMESILEMLPDGTPVVWVNVHLGHFSDATDEANAIIDSVVASRPNTWVADWNSMADEEPGLLTDDGVHLRESGEVAYSLTISIAVAEAGRP